MPFYAKRSVTSCLQLNELGGSLCIVGFGVSIDDKQSMQVWNAGGKTRQVARVRPGSQCGQKTKILCSSGWTECFRQCDRTRFYTND